MGNRYFTCAKARPINFNLVEVPDDVRINNLLITFSWCVTFHWIEYVNGIMVTVTSGKLKDFIWRTSFEIAWIEWAGSDKRRMDFRFLSCKWLLPKSNCRSTSHLLDSAYCTLQLTVLSWCATNEKRSVVLALPRYVHSFQTLYCSSNTAIMPRVRGDLHAELRDINFFRPDVVTVVPAHEDFCLLSCNAMWSVLSDYTVSQFRR